MIYEIFLLFTSDENFDYVKDIEVNIALTLEQKEIESEKHILIE